MLRFICTIFTRTRFTLISASKAWDVNSLLHVLFFNWHFGVCDSEDEKLKLIAKEKSTRKSQGEEGVWGKETSKGNNWGEGGQILSFMVKEKKWPWNTALSRSQNHTGDFSKATSGKKTSYCSINLSVPIKATSTSNRFWCHTVAADEGGAI